MAEERDRKYEDDSEIIGQRKVDSDWPKRVKIKIKERVSRRKPQRLSWPIKIVIILLAAVFGYMAGEKVVMRYFSFWKNPHIDYRPIDGSKPEEFPQLKAGQEFSSNSSD